MIAKQQANKQNKLLMNAMFIAKIFLNPLSAFTKNNLKLKAQKKYYEKGINIACGCGNSIWI